jgi:signal transduction histidine kinase
MGECVYADILEQISLGIIGLDLERREVFFQNRCAIDIFMGNICPKDFRGLSTLLLGGGGRAIDDGGTTVGKLRYGSRFLGYSVYRISESLLWIFVSDITEKTRLAAVAEAVNTMNNLGYIFSGIRHELGNPVNSVKTAATVLKQNLGSFSRETVAEYVDRMLADLNRVEVLLRDLKSYSMYEAPETRDVDLPGLVENLVAMSRRDFARERIRITTILRPEAGRVRADPRALQQVLLNLMTNAADALRGRPDQEIAISTRLIDGRVLVTIRDNGCGIPEEQRKHLFIPFSTTKTTGTGLGLVIVQKMLAKMGGTVEIESAAGIGTAVTINLPQGAASRA